MADGDLAHTVAVDEARHALNLAIWAAEEHGLTVKVSEGMGNRLDPNPGAVQVSIFRVYHPREISRAMAEVSRG